MKAFLKIVTSLLLVTYVNAGEPFIFTVKTDNPGTSADNNFTIPAAGFRLEYKVDCESDGHYEKLTVRGPTTCSYATAGTYKISIDGTFKRIFFNNSGDKDKIIMINQWGDIAWTSMEGAFYGAHNLELNSSAPAPDLSEVTSMYRMFSNAKKFNTDINHWDVSHIENMQQLFSSASSFNGNIGDWDVSNVTNMSGMFLRATNFNQNLNSWNVSNVLNMRAMFNLASSFEGEIKDWNVSKVGDMSGMFLLATSFDSNISHWDVSGVLNMDSMFQGAKHFNQDIGAWNVAHVSHMQNMFEEAELFNQDIGAWNTSLLSSTKGMFRNAFRFNQDIGDWNMSSVLDSSKMFKNAYAFDQDIGSWNLSHDRNMSEMFDDARVFNQDIGEWNVSNVTDMSSMFANTLYFNQDIGEWNVSKVTTMKYMFYDAKKFNQDLGDWDVSHVSNMRDMLSNAVLSISHYDNLLISWQQQELQDNINITISDGKYCDGNSSRSAIMTQYNWIFHDYGLSCDYHITSDSEMIVEHNQSDIGTITVSHDFYDPRFSIAGGADADKFDINASTGVLRFIDAPDFYNPTDRNGDNIYRVTIHYEIARSPAESKDYQSVHVKVVEKLFDGSLVPIMGYLLF